MSPLEVKNALNEEPRQFPKGLSPNVVEAYNLSGVHAHYDADDLLEFIEAFSPSQPVYAGVDLLRVDASTTVDELALLGLSVRDDGEGGLWFDEHGFALYAPAGHTEGVSVFRRGYDTGA
jgi:hypothetical protein